MKRILLFYQNLLRQNRRWIVLASKIALASVMAGMLLVLLFPQTLPYLLSQLEEIFDRILGKVKPEPTLQFARVLLRQNLQAAFYNIFLGAALGLLPLGSLAINFFALGFLTVPFLRPELLGAETGSFFTFLLAILPHGIFELPALIFSAAFGLRLGWEWARQESRGHRRMVFKAALFDSVKMVPLIFVLLVIAALAEAFVTGNLVF